MKKIILTGGGTAGHVTPCLALLPALRGAGFDVSYIGGKAGMERELVGQAGIPYYGVSTGKLRRYFDLKNLTDAGRVIKGVWEAVSILRAARPDVIFSKGGFVAVPVVVAGRLLGIPAVIHESDISCGLANKICLPFAKAVCVSFPETLAKVPKKKAFVTGTPIRRELFDGRREKGLGICGFGGGKPVALVMGGSLGSVKINGVLRQALPGMLERFDVIHICGKGNLAGDLGGGKDAGGNKGISNGGEGLGGKQEILSAADDLAGGSVSSGKGLAGYAQFEYVNEDLPHLFAAADIAISRAGANALAELLALAKPSILIPLSKKASRGDQILNAESFGARGFCRVIREEELTAERLASEVAALWQNAGEYAKKMKAAPQADGVGEVVKVITSHLLPPGERP
uniref:UDP-N-acetylglucosamine--N-acetylmuramyl-(pentapeptide) pyrophosphoryl-undecaprenol N-acetylglucosamine transferase n=1 Tax=uncultured bacterium contig00081 TaxID=1181557 RepID=A0A806K0I6_9BACT|nr:UDP-N-acetylglucosamine--N-acetylmuramyl-(pentapeptide) pyrophosphoryl-undecaprenol N-acetylglucosamine transferase [uncultured bacterium contig00081]